MAGPKKRIRLREFVIGSALSGDLDFTAIMSDILPDEAWELCAVGLSINTKVGTGVVTYVALGKNVYPQEVPLVNESLQSKSGVIIHWEPKIDNALGVSSMASDFVNFDKPIHFDESDELNIYMRNSGPAQQTTFVVNLHYRLV